MAIEIEIINKESFIELLDYNLLEKNNSFLFDLFILYSEKLNISKSSKLFTQFLIDALCKIMLIKSEKNNINNIYFEYYKSDDDFITIKCFSILKKNNGHPYKYSININLNTMKILQIEELFKILA